LPRKHDCYVIAYKKVKLEQCFPTIPTCGPPTAALNVKRRTRHHAMVTWPTLQTNWREKRYNSWIHTLR